mgnify:CR=1 FL=1
MTQKELEQKVIDAEGRVAKREAVLKKHNSQLAKICLLYTSDAADEL